MATKKKKSHSIKGFRGSQESHHASTNDAIRLRPENVGALVHDESDTISYRVYLTQNVIKASEMIDILTTQNVPQLKVLPPRIYRNLNVEAVQDSVAAEKEEISRLETLLQNHKFEMPLGFAKLSEMSAALVGEDVKCESMAAIEKEYMAQFGKRLQNDRVVVHYKQFPQLRGDLSEASADYWEKRREIVAKQKEEEAKLKAVQEQEEELKRQEEETARLRQRQEEEAMFSDPFGQQQQQNNQQIPGGVMAYSGSGVESQQQQTDASQQGILGSIFGDMNGENFNNGFEDEFGELDTAFF
ncbi:LADA_0G03202g1_1 [Lachancea dasiensis]|uniref:LADA_0G03202g1_1 n=1 Tax=Lachancea dasiensis TaxID=1072105 RepID=A0A1G4JRJ7_9SACH|nr:LADA_0G03202g1_1 [Lachancea dasiensis]